MSNWKEIAITFAKNEMTAPEVTRKLRDLGYLSDIPYTKAYDRVRKYVGRHLGETAFQKVVVTRNVEPRGFNHGWNGEHIIRFALIGDTHLNSKYTQLTALNDFYDYCANHGVYTIYHTGDIDDGYKMRVGHDNELYTVGADNHVAEIVKNYPYHPEIDTYFICGNHDASIYKNCGYDIGPAIARERSDMHYLGRDCAVVALTPEITLELRHPWDATGASISARIQKMIDMSDNKPSILAVGHYHNAEQLYHRGVHAFQTASFQSATPFTIGRGITCATGGWIVEVRVDANGNMISCSGQFIPAKCIKNDYQNYPRA